MLAGDKDSKLKVVVTDKDGKTFESAETSAVAAENKSAEIKIADISGLQTDGTGLVGDTLRISYGADLGNPRTITWYYNGAVTQAYTSQSGNITDAITLYTGDMRQRKDGDYYAVIINDAGQASTSNTITLVYDQLRAVIKDFSVQDDLTDASHVTHDVDDNKAVISITLNKDYDGDFYIYEDDVVKYSQNNYVSTQPTIDDAYYTKVSTANKLTANRVLTDGDIYYVADDGAITYMFDATLTRGSSYKVVFDQDGIEDDTVPATGTLANDKANITESKEAAYLPAPSALRVDTAASLGYTAVSILDADGEVMAWMGDGTSGDTLGFKSFDVYSDGDGDAADGKKATPATFNIKNGVYTGTNTVGDSFYYAKAITKKGIYGKDSVTLTSAAKAAALPIASKAKISDSNATDAKIALAGIAEAATVYIYPNMDNQGVANSFDASDSSTYVGKAAVNAGESSVTISDVFDAKDIGKKYAAVVIPAKEGSIFGKYEGDKFTLPKTATSLEYNADKATSVTVLDITTATDPVLNGADEITVLDQFGNPYDPDERLVATNAPGKFTGIVDKTAGVTTNDSNGKTKEAGNAAFSVDQEGVLTVTLSITGNDDPAKAGACDIADGFNVAILGSTLKYTAAKPLVAGIGLDADSDVEVKLGDDVVVAGVLGAAVTVDNFGDLKAALAATKDDTDTDTTVTMSAPITIPVGQSLTIGVEDTLDPDGNALTNNGTLTILGALGTVGAGKTVGSGTYKLAGTTTVNQAAATKLVTGINAGTATVEFATDTTLTTNTVFTAGKIKIDSGVTLSDDANENFGWADTLTNEGRISLDGAGTFAGAALTSTGSITKASVTTTGTVTLSGTVDIATKLTVADNSTLTIDPESTITALVVGATTAGAGRFKVSDGVHTLTLGAHAATGDVDAADVDETKTVTVADSQIYDITIVDSIIHIAKH